MRLCICRAFIFPNFIKFTSFGIPHQSVHRSGWIWHGGRFHTKLTPTGIASCSCGAKNSQSTPSNLNTSECPPGILLVVTAVTYSLGLFIKILSASAAIAHTLMTLTLEPAVFITFSRTFLYSELSGESRGLLYGSWGSGGSHVSGYVSPARNNDKHKNSAGLNTDKDLTGRGCYVFTLSHHAPYFPYVDKLCDLVYQPPTKAYRSQIPVAFSIPGHVTTKHLPDTPC